MNEIRPQSSLNCHFTNKKETYDTHFLHRSKDPTEHQQHSEGKPDDKKQKDEEEEQRRRKRKRIFIANTRTKDEISYGFPVCHFGRIFRT